MAVRLGSDLRGDTYGAHDLAGVVNDSNSLFENHDGCWKCKIFASPRPAETESRREEMQKQSQRGLHEVKLAGPKNCR